MRKGPVLRSHGRWSFGIFWRCIAPGYPEIEKEAEDNGLVQDPDVLDTWFSSMLWPHSTLGGPEPTPESRGSHHDDRPSPGQRDDPQ